MVIHRFGFELLESRRLLATKPSLIQGTSRMAGDELHGDGYVIVGDVGYFTDPGGGTLNEDLPKSDAATDGTTPGTELRNLAATPPIPELREYRIAVAATGQYTQTVGGTVADAMFEIQLAIDRVNLVYERDLGIRFKLVENNAAVVYTNPFTDPYTNNVPELLVFENQENLDAVIGSENYDLGHVFGTVETGLSFLGVAGQEGIKGLAMSGHPFPFFDDFYIDIFAHELGHQLNADHTFNGDSGFCAIHRNALTAVEPGSGSTIMAYAGLCDDDDLQPFADPYFHAVSIQEIALFTDVTIPHVGNRINTNNSAPSISAASGFFIPAATPFTLDASASDADDDVLTYTWEQIDLGPPLDVNAPDNGASALFRSLPPSLESARVFPRLDHILSGTNSFGETLPTTNRDLNFRATVRDNHVGGGAVAFADVVVHAVDTGAAFQVTEPDGDVLWTNNTNRSVSWSVSGTDVAPINASTVDILLSTDGGQSFPIVLAAETPNDGVQQIFVPDGILTDQARIKIQAVGNVFFSISDVHFSIGGRRTCSRLEDFDSAVPPALPDGWVSSGTTALWHTVDSQSHSSPNHVFVADLPGIGDNRLTSPLIPVDHAAPQLRFQNHFNSETYFDGGVLEISMDEGAFQDILGAGGVFIDGGYNLEIDPFFGNPLAGRLAWSGDSLGYIETIVDLPQSAIGHDVRFRWRQATDESFEFVGWSIDTIELCGITRQGDLNDDGKIDAVDIDLLFAELGSAPTESTDLIPDSVVDQQDVAFIIENILKTAFGDVNLDQTVNNADFGFVLGGFGFLGLGWNGGDVNGDGITNNADFGSVLGSFGFGL